MSGMGLAIWVYGMPAKIPIRYYSLDKWGGSQCSIAGNDDTIMWILTPERTFSRCWWTHKHTVICFRVQESSHYHFDISSNSYSPRYFVALELWNESSRVAETNYECVMLYQNSLFTWLYHFQSTKISSNSKLPHSTTLHSQWPSLITQLLTKSIQ